MHAFKQALPGKRGTVFHVPLADLILIRDREHPLYDPRIEDPFVPGIVCSVREHGVQIPLLVARLDQGVVVIDGKQRLRAAREARLATVPCVQVKGSLETLYGVMVLTNEVRRDDTPLATPLAKARKVSRFMGLYSGTNPIEATRQAALVFGVTPKTIKSRLKLLQTAQVVQTAVEEGRISWWAAAELAGLPDAKQEQALEESLSAAAASEGRKSRPNAEDTRAAAGKGDAAHRKAMTEARGALVAAAIQYGGSAKLAGSYDLKRLETLNNAAIAFWRLVSKQ